MKLFSEDINYLIELVEEDLEETIEVHRHASEYDQLDLHLHILQCEYVLEELKKEVK